MGRNVAGEDVAGEVLAGEVLVRVETPVFGHGWGAQVQLTRTPLVDGLIAQGRLTVLAGHTAPAAQPEPEQPEPQPEPVAEPEPVAPVAEPEPEPVAPVGWFTSPPTA